MQSGLHLSSHAINLALTVEILRDIFSLCSDRDGSKLLPSYKARSDRASVCLVLAPKGRAKPKLTGICPKKSANNLDTVVIPMTGPLVAIMCMSSKEEA